MELDNPLLLKNLVFRTGFASQAKAFGERKRSAGFVEAGEMLLECPDRFFSNEIHDGLDKFVIARVQIDVEDAGHENGIPNLEGPSISIPDQLGDYVVARDLTRNAFGHIPQTLLRLLTGTGEMCRHSRPLAPVACIS